MPNYLMQQDNVNIGERIRKIRKEFHMNRDQFSEMIHISEVYLGRIERGERSISMNTLTKITASTGFSANYILYGSSEQDSTLEKINKLLANCSEEQLHFFYEFILLSRKFEETL